MSLFDSINPFGKKKDSQIYKDIEDGFFMPMTGGSSLKWENNTYLKDYLEVPEINAIINQKSRAFSNGILKVVSKTTNKEIVSNDPLIKVLRNPNWFQSAKEFRMQTKIFREVFGNEFMYLLTPVGQKESYKALFTLPPQKTEIEIVGTSNPYFLLDKKPENIRYKVKWNDKYEPIDYDSLIHINSNNGYVKEDTYLLGRSVLSGVQPNIQNLRVAYEARNVLIENRGALGIFTNDSKDATGAARAITLTDKENIQKDFSRYGITKEKWQFIITSLSLKYQQIGVSVKDLMLFEECQEDRERICDAFGFPIELLSSNKGTTFANKNEASKLLYQNTIIPEAQEWVDALNDRFDTQSKDWHIVITFDHIACLQEDLKSRGQSLTLLTGALSKAYLDKAITLAQYQDELKKFGI